MTRNTEVSSRWFEDAIELFYFAHRAIVAEPDQVLLRRGLGRVHHRLLYCVGRNPGITIGQLCVALRVSKQAVHGPLTKLENEGLVARTIDPTNRRLRALCLTRTGVALDTKLSDGQRLRLGRAFRAAGPRAVAGWQAVMRRVSEA